MSSILRAETPIAVEHGNLVLPMAGWSVRGGFPLRPRISTLIAWISTAILVTHPQATFQVAGDSMREAGLFDGDLLVVDRALKPAHQDVVAVVDGEFHLQVALAQIWAHEAGGGEPHVPGNRPEGRPDS